MYRCVGCDAQIPWDGRSLFSYTCACGSTLFYNEETGALAMPSGVARRITIGGEMSPHLDDLVGESEYVSPKKTEAISMLREKGFTWMRECEQCKKDGTLTKREARLARDRRQQEINERAKREGWDMERTIEELVKADKEDRS